MSFRIPLLRGEKSQIKSTKVSSGQSQPLVGIFAAAGSDSGCV